MEYFRIFDLPPKLDIDMADLQRRFHELSRQHHPDYHTTQSADAQERSLRMTALLNDAYRTLRDPTRRAEYLVRSSGLDVDGRKVPQSLLMEVFEINEELEAVRAARAGGQVDAGALAGLAEFRTMLESRRGDYDAELTEAAWNPVPVRTNADLLWNALQKSSPGPRTSGTWNVK